MIEKYDMKNKKIHSKAGAFGTVFQVKCFYD